MSLDLDGIRAAHERIRPHIMRAPVLTSSRLDEASGAATHSSGNHRTALARAAKLRGVPAHFVMPSNSAKVKVRAVESYGAPNFPIDSRTRHACLYRRMITSARLRARCSRRKQT